MKTCVVKVMNSQSAKPKFFTKKTKTASSSSQWKPLYIDVPDEFTGIVIDKLSQRKGELRNMGMSNGGYTRLEFSIPSRGLIGYRGEFLTDTKGNGIMNTAFDGYAPYKGDIQYRSQGSLIAFETGEVCSLRSVQRTGSWNTLHRTW